MTHRLSHSTAPSNAGYSGYMADAGLPRLQQSTTTSNTSGVSTPAASSSDTPELATFYIHSALHRSGQLFHVNKPADIPSSPPVKIRRPKFPETRQLTMCRFPPCVFYVQYPCEQKCRSLGICIHYQFVVSCRKCPDGLRCDLCVASGIEEPIQAGRRCPLHQDPMLANPISSRPEDFLATDVQKQVCDEVLARSFACNWDDVPAAVVEEEGSPAEAGQAAATAPFGLDAPTAVASPALPGGATPGMTTASAAHGFDRESTPQTMHDVAMLETVREECEDEASMMPYAQNQSGLHCQHIFGISPDVLSAPLPAGFPHGHGRRMGQRV